MEEGNGSYKNVYKKPRERNKSINSTGNIIPSKNIRRYLKYVFNLRAVIASMGKAKLSLQILLVANVNKRGV